LAKFEIERVVQWYQQVVSSNSIAVLKTLDLLGFSALSGPSPKARQFVDDMPLIQPIPLGALQTIYAKWQDAPLGSLLASGAVVGIPKDNGWERVNAPMIAIRAKASAGPLLVSVAPKSQLLFEPSNNRSMFSSPSVVYGPAVEIGNTHELAIADLAPTNAVREFAAGDVVHDPSSGNIYAVVDYPDYANMGLVLKGDEQWIVTRMPSIALTDKDPHKIGVIVVRAKDAK
jgi:hypothetical protein